MGKVSHNSPSGTIALIKRHRSLRNLTFAFVSDSSLYLNGYDQQNNLKQVILCILSQCTEYKILNEKISLYVGHEDISMINVSSHTFDFFFLMR